MIMYLTAASEALGSFFFIATIAYEGMLTISTPTKIRRRSEAVATKDIPAVAMSISE